MKFGPTGPIDNKSVLVRVMAWCRKGDKRLPEAMMIQFADAYIYVSLGGHVVTHMLFHSVRYWPYSWSHVRTEIDVGIADIHRNTITGINTLRPRQDGCYFADDVLKCIFLNENVWIFLNIPLKFVPKGPNYNIPALVRIMDWRRPGDKPLSEPMMDSLPTHLCVTRAQWVKPTKCHTDTSCMRYGTTGSRTCEVSRPCTVYPKKYAHGFVVLCFVVVMQSFIMNSHEVFIHIHQGCFAGTGAIFRLPQCQWSKPDGYGKISQCITTTKHCKAKTVCIFLGIYSTYWCRVEKSANIYWGDIQLKHGISIWDMSCNDPIINLIIS